MKAALLLLAFTQWDMRPSEPNPAWEMRPNPAAKPVAMWSMAPERVLDAERLLQATGASTKPRVDIYAPYWSAASSSALDEIESLRADYSVTIYRDDTRFPEWVKNHASEAAGGGYPLATFVDRNRINRSVPWTTAARFCVAYEATQAPAPVVAQREGGYPVHRPRWNVEGDWNPSTQKLLAHLSGNRNHAGKWDSAWLRSLSHAELASLHDDDHERRVKWEYVRRPTQPVIAQAQTPAVVGTRPKTVRSACPSGRCPTFGYLK